MSQDIFSLLDCLLLILILVPILVLVFSGSLVLFLEINLLLVEGFAIIDPLSYEKTYYSSYHEFLYS